MGIKALPANAVRAIGSTQCLTDPVSLVKELVENSLDANATSIHIEIASNTIDKIRVRDNGHGITPDDRALVCKRYYTSKIRNLEDLHDLGGRSLGFRGEALASALELSAGVCVSTRIEGEQTAMEIVFGREGVVENETPSSDPIGSTVSVDHFLSNVLVRKNLAEKKASKSLVRMKTLLQRYALARPSVRFAFKVLKAKVPKGDWNYGPRSGLRDELSSFKSLVLDAAVKIFGPKIADALLYVGRKWKSKGEIIDVSSAENWDRAVDSDNEYLIEGYIINPLCIANIPSSGMGQYFSIDNRPVSCERGPLKQISSNYRSCFRSSTDRIGTGKYTDPLLILNLKCPKGSYDINVEPSKDDVLFYDSELIVDRVLSMFNEIYGDKPPDLKKQPVEGMKNDNHPFDILLATRPVTTDTPNSQIFSFPSSDRAPPGEREDHTSQTVSDDSANPQTPGRLHGTDGFEANLGPSALLSDGDEVRFLETKKAQWNNSMCGTDDDDFTLRRSSQKSSQRESESEDEAENLHDIKLSNPWTFAKLSGPFRTPLRRSQKESDSPSEQQISTQQQKVGETFDGIATFPDSPEQSPFESATFFPYPQKPFDKSKIHDQYASSASPGSISRSDGDLNVWMQMPNAKTSSKELIFGHTPKPSSGPKITTAQRGISLREIPDVSRRPRRHSISPRKQMTNTANPFVSPVNDLERVWFDNVGTSKSRKHQQKLSRGVSQTSPVNVRDVDTDVTQSHSSVSTFVNPDLDLALDYEARKTKATKDHRENLRRTKAVRPTQQQGGDAMQYTIDSLFNQKLAKPSPKSPHRNRQTKAVEALQAEKETVINSLTDPGRLENRLLKEKKPRLKFLPLESVREEYWVSDLVLPFVTSLDETRGQMQEALEWDEFVNCGEISNNLENLAAGLLQEWEVSLRRLLRKQYVRRDAHRGEDPGCVREHNFTLHLQEELSKSTLTKN